MDLKEYHRKRNFSETPEPRGGVGDRRGELRFVVQMHDASRVHYDFRIEMDGTFKSWAVPKGPSLNPNDQRLAVFVEDHPIEYGGFEGIIPKGNYGAGTVMIWDAGTFHERGSSTPEESVKNLLAGLEKGHITIVVSGRKIGGEFAFIKMKDASDPKTWLLVKKRDEFASYSTDVTEQDRSVASGRSMREITEEAAAHNAIWLPGKGIKDPTQLNDFLYFTGERLQPAPEKKAGPPEHVATASIEKTEDAKTERLPRKNKPMLPQMAGRMFQDPDWIYELNWNGFRAIAEVEQTRVSFYSRQGLDYRKKFPDLTKALQKLRINAVLDGEIVVLDDDGRPSADLLHQFSRKKKGRPAYLVHDLLHFDGKNYRELPFYLRQKALRDLGIFGELVQEPASVAGNPDELLATARASAAPAIIAKHRLSPYSSGTSNSWIHIDLTGEADAAMMAPKITHPDKIYWPEEHLTKGDLIAYYESMADFVLPYLRDRPESLNRHPNGIHGESFFQKDMVQHVPPFVSTFKVWSESSDKSINYVLCQNRETLIWMANLGCIELNPWLSRTEHPENPDWSVIDLDPDDNDFSEVVQVALLVKRVLDEVGAECFVKTSGSSGMHILVPTGARFSYDVTRSFAEEVCRVVNRQLPKLTSIERNPAKRRRKIYLDFMQNRRGQTLAAPYCLRPRIHATASAPLHWDEVTPDLKPLAFTIRNMRERVSKVGDLWRDILTRTVEIEPLIEKIRLLDI